MKRKRILLTLILAVCLMSSATTYAAVGSAFGALSTAHTVGQGKGDLGGGLGLGDATSFMATFTFGSSEYTDVKFKLGLVDAAGSDAKLALGADFKWQYLVVEEDSTPVDLSFGGLVEYTDFDFASVFQIGAFVTSSWPIQLKGGGGKLTPYGRFNARLESISLDLPVGYSGDSSESNLEVGLNAGVEWKPNSTITLFGEFQLDGNDGLFLGVNLNVM